jgi:hypothetical protein
MSSRRLNLSFSEDLYAGLDEFAQSAGYSKAEILRLALREFLKARPFGPSCYDIAVLAGLIGCVSGGIPSSTDPDAMNGFGESRTD